VRSLVIRIGVGAVGVIVAFGAWSPAGLLRASAPPLPIESGRNLTLVRVTAEPADYRGRRALRVAEPKVGDGGGIAIVDGTTFRNGTIEADIAGQPAPGAGAEVRGFVGIAFRVQRDPLRYEAFYIRPTNGRADDQLRRNHSTQYVSEPEFPWHRLRKEHPGVYESYVDLETGAWTRVRIVVNGTKAQLYVHGAPQPALIVNDLRLGDVAGGIGLFIGVGTEAHFSSLNVTSE
jgi:hypothetical protein